MDGSAHIAYSKAKIGTKLSRTPDTQAMANLYIGYGFPLFEYGRMNRKRFTKRCMRRIGYLLRRRPLWTLAACMGLIGLAFAAPSIATGFVLLAMLADWF